MKQSSIEWLKQEFEKIGDATRLDITWNEFDSIIEKAKEMHKQEVIDAYDKGDENGANRVYYNSDRDDKSAEQYYNETYNIER